jgi:hypothetical protein
MSSHDRAASLLRDGVVVAAISFAGDLLVVDEQGSWPTPDSFEKITKKLLDAVAGPDPLPLPQLAPRSPDAVAAAAVPWFDRDPAVPLARAVRFHRATIAFGPGGSLLVAQAAHRARAADERLIVAYPARGSRKARRTTPQRGDHGRPRRGWSSVIGNRVVPAGVAS